MQAFRAVSIYALLMAAIVVASNILVQFPLTGTLFGVALGDLLPSPSFRPFAVRICTGCPQRPLTCPSNAMIWWPKLLAPAASA